MHSFNHQDSISIATSSCIIGGSVVVLIYMIDDIQYIDCRMGCYVRNPSMMVLDSQTVAKERHNYPQLVVK